MATDWCDASEVGVNWLECNGQTIPADSDLRKQQGMTVTPNLYADSGHFLRPDATPGNKVADIMRSHDHMQPAHTHELPGELNNTVLTAQMTNRSVKGEAAPMYYGDWTAQGTDGLEASEWKFVEGLGYFVKSLSGEVV